MKRTILILSILTTLLLCICFWFLSCGTLVTVKEDPFAGGTQTIQNVGVARFAITLKGNPHALMKIGDAEEHSIIGGISGIQTICTVVVKAPDALKNYAVTKSSLGKINQDAWIEILSGKDYNITLIEGLMTIHKFSNKSPDGMTVDGYSSVVPIDEILGTSESSSTIREIGEAYPVDAVLAGEAEVLAEILRSTGETDPDKDDQDRTFFRNEFIINFNVYYDWVLYDAKSGDKISSLDDMTIKYSELSSPGSNYKVLPLPAGNYDKLFDFLNGQEFGEYILLESIPRVSAHAHYLMPHYHQYYE